MHLSQSLRGSQDTRLDNQEDRELSKIVQFFLSHGSSSNNRKKATHEIITLIKIPALYFTFYLHPGTDEDTEALNEVRS